MHYWLIGIAGVAMGGLAIALKELGHEVNGSDEGVYPPMSTMLEEAGVRYHSEFDATKLMKWAEGKTASNDLRIIVGNAIPRGNAELEAAMDAGLRLTCLPTVIHEEFLEGCHRLVVSGTHGKTTTSNLIAYIMFKMDCNPGWMIGGKAFGLPSSLQAAPKSSLQEPGISPPFIIEGDEYDTVFYDKRSKFFHYWPDTLIINHIEFDHADIFPNISEIQTAFRRLVNQVPSRGVIVYNGDEKTVREVIADALCPLLTFGTDESSDYQLLHERASENGSWFMIRLPRLQDDDLLLAASQVGNEPKTELEIFSPLQGAYNGRNLLAALAACDFQGLPRKGVLQAISTFTGPGRRMDRYDLGQDLVLFDDFAHHPTAVKESLDSLRNRFPEHRITAIVEPRSNTSVRNILQNDWERALALADSVIMGALHRPWKYKPEDLFDFQKAGTCLQASGTDFAQFDRVDNIAEHLWKTVSAANNGALTKHAAGAKQLWVIFSNGNFGGLRDKLVERFQ
jgi:UDP-N-acetylmuramate: L-alanyl-gamma-D-glutamyl-meso-diaminopimelate ligase